jgi:hypothetical protein
MDHGQIQGSCQEGPTDLLLVSQGQEQHRSKGVALNFNFVVLISMDLLKDVEDTEDCKPPPPPQQNGKLEISTFEKRNIRLGLFSSHKQLIYWTN